MIIDYLPNTSSLSTALTHTMITHCPPLQLGVHVSHTSVMFSAKFSVYLTAPDLHLSLLPAFQASLIRVEICRSRYCSHSVGHVNITYLSCRRSRVMPTRCKCLLYTSEPSLKPPLSSLFTTSAEYAQSQKQSRQSQDY